MTNDKIITDAELLKLGVDYSLIELRREYNDRIKAGICSYKKNKVVRAFISNPHGYFKVFLLADDGNIIDHGIMPCDLARVKWYKQPNI